MTDAVERREPVRLDALDRRIVEILQADARTSTRAIARRLGVAAGTVGERIARFERTGVITGYTATVDQAAIGRRIGFVVGLQINQGCDLDAALDEVAAIPEVDDVFVVTGRWDLFVIGRVAGPDELNRLLTKGLWQAAMFRHSETMVVLDERRCSVGLAQGAEADVAD
jgi:Lrp/AsnC family transcriptional regulator for asnA, asnC and gidA